MRSIAALLLVAALSGCLGGEDAPDPLDAETPDASAPGPDPAGAAGTLRALLEVTLPANATAPVALTVDAPGAADPGNASWNLVELGNDTQELLAAGTGVPATVNHTFPAGPHTVRLEVLDGDLDANQTRSFVVDAIEGAGEAAGNATGNETDAAEPLATVHVLTDAFAGGQTDPTFSPVPDPGTGPVRVLEFPVPHDAVAVQVWVDWDDGETGNSPLLVDLDPTFYDGAGTEIAALASAQFEYAYVEGSFAAGTWSVHVLPFSVPLDTTYTVEVVAWKVVPQTVVLSGSSEGGFELSTPADLEPDVHAVPLPAGTQTVSARLAWSLEGLTDCAREDAIPNDYDFDALLGGDRKFGRGSFASCEFGVHDGAGEDLGGDWSFEVHKYLTAPSSYELTVFYA